MKVRPNQKETIDNIERPGFAELNEFPGFSRTLQEKGRADCDPAEWSFGCKPAGNVRIRLSPLFTSPDTPTPDVAHLTPSCRMLGENH